MSLLCHSDLAKEELYVWIMDVTDSSDEERQRIASMPSNTSAELTRQFRIRGQDPEVHFVNHGFLGLNNSASDATFDVLGGYWIMHVTVIAYQTPVIHMKGREIALHDCFVRDGFMPLSTPAVFQNLSSSVHYFADPSFTVTDPCDRNTAIVGNQFGLFYTTDGFRTYDEITALPLHTIRNTLAVNGAAFTYTYLVLLFSDQGIFLMNKTTGDWKKITAITNDVISGIAGPQYCHQGLFHQMNQDIFGLWTSGTLFINRRLTHETFHELPIPVGLVTNATGHGVPIATGCVAQIVRVAFTYIPNNMSAIIKCHTDMFLMLHDLKTGQWQQIAHFTSTAPIEQMQLFALRNALEEYIFFNSNIFYLVKDGGVEALQTCNAQPPSLTFDVTLQHLIFTNSVGDIILYVERGQIIHVLAHSDCMLEFQEEPNEASVAWMDTLHEMFVITITDVLFERKPLLIKQGIINALIKINQIDVKCPYVEFKCDKYVDMIHLDKGDAWPVTCTLMYERSIYKQSLQLDYQARDYVSLIVTNSFDISGNSVKESMTIIIAQTWKVGESENYTDAMVRCNRIVGFQVRPAFVLPTCESPTSYSTHFTIGCPFGRHIRVRRDAVEHCPEFHDKSYIIEEQHIGQQELISAADDDSHATEGGILVRYDFKKWGCPLEMSSAVLRYIPDLLLYDGDTFVKKVDVNFVIWEEHNRIDFSFNTTMYDVLCWRRSYTWESLVEDAPDGVQFYDLWGPENHIDCFSREEGLGRRVRLSEPYQVLNRTGNSAIVFPFTYDALYLFNVKIVDPDYSYCDLNTRFAIYTYGSQTEADSRTIAIVLSIFSVCVILFLTTTYFYYKDNVYLMLD